MNLSSIIPVRFPRVRRAGWLLSLCIASAIASTSFAQETANDFLEPRLDRSQYEWLIKELGLERDQRMIAELLYSDYTTALTDATASADAAAENAGRKSVQDAVSGRTRVNAEDLQRMRLAVLRAYETVGPGADRALDDFLTGTHSLLTPEQEPSFAPTIRLLNRKLYLHPLQESRNFEEYAGDGVDVLLLIEESLKDGGELQPLGRGPLADTLAAYESQLDSLVESTGGQWRDGRLASKIAQFSKDTGEIARQQQAAIERWKRLYQLNQWAVQSVGQIALANLGEAAQQQWIDRFDRASFSWLFPRTRPERQFDWIMAKVQEEPKQQKAREILDAYQANRRNLARTAIGIMVRARTEFHTILYAMMPPSGMDPAIEQGLYRELLRNSGEQELLEANTSTQLESLLDDAQRKAMRDALKRPEPVRRR